MATLNKKLKIKSGSSTQSCNIYTTTTEAGTDNLKLKVDNTNVYASLTTTSDSQASKGRIKKNGTTKAIAISGKLPYTEKSWTTPGTYTFTVPAGINRIRVAVCGGGGGATVCGEDDDDNHSYTGYSGSGSSFANLITATGGSGGSIKITVTDSGKAYIKNGSGSGGAGGTPNGNAGNCTIGKNYNQSHTSTGGNGFELNFIKTLKSNGYGNGGYATVINGYGVTVNAAGGSGGYNTGYITVTPGNTYSITVGTGGSYRVDYFEGNSHTEYAAKNGAVLIAYGGDI